MGQWAWRMRHEKTFNFINNFDRFHQKWNSCVVSTILSKLVFCSRPILMSFPKLEILLIIFELKMTNAKLKFSQCEKVPEKGILKMEGLRATSNEVKRQNWNCGTSKIMMMWRMRIQSEFLYKTSLLFFRKRKKKQQPIFEPLSGISFIILMQFNQLQILLSNWDMTIFLRLCWIYYGAQSTKCSLSFIWRIFVLTEKKMRIESVNETIMMSFTICIRK